MTVADCQSPNPTRTSPNDPHYTKVAAALTRSMIRGFEHGAENRREAKRLAAGVLDGTMDPGNWVAAHYHNWTGGGVACCQWGGVDQVYLIQMLADGPTRPVKVGRSNSPERRMGAHQCSSPFPLTLLGSFPFPLAPELELHRMFRADHIRGEWFKPSETLLAAAEWMRGIAAMYPPLEPWP